MNSILKKIFASVMIMIFLVGVMGQEAMAMGKWPGQKKTTGATTTTTSKPAKSAKPATR